VFQNLVNDDMRVKVLFSGRPVELVLEDSATSDSVAEAKAAKLVERDKVDVVFGGIYSSTRQAIKRSSVERAGKLYIYPEQYGGQECHPLMFCAGPVPAQQPTIPWLIQQKCEEVLPAVGRLYLVSRQEQQGS
jgi:urea transport system substrate-binding protein